MRLIDADALKEFIDDCGICAICPQRAPRCSYDCDFPDFVTEKWNVAIDAQPTVDAVSEWIPCSEMLPKVDERVLITFRASYRTLVVDGCRKGKDMWDIEEFSNYIYDENVVAWMPLPKPYEETDHE